MTTELKVRAQASLFALMVIARPATNRELREVAGIEITADVRKQARYAGADLIVTTKRGAVNTHGLSTAGLSWCESALVAGRPDDAKFPAGVLFAVLENIGQYLARSGTKGDDFFRPDIETWIRAVYAELTVRSGPGTWVKLSKVRPWLAGVPAAEVDAELDRMIELPDVQLMAELTQRSLTEDERKAAVDIGGEPRHLLLIGPA